MKRIFWTTAGCCLLGGAVWTLRHRELAELRQKAAGLSQEMAAAAEKSAALAGRKPEAAAPAFDAVRVLADFEDLSSGRVTDKERWKLLTEIITKLSPEQQRAVIFAARGISGVAPDFLYEITKAVILRMALVDPGMAAVLLTELEPSDSRLTRLIHSCANTWFGQDPGKCAEWLERSLAAGKFRNSGVYERLKKMAALGKVMGNPVGSLDFVRSQPTVLQTGLLQAAVPRLKTAGDTRTFAAAVIAWAPLEEPGTGFESALDPLGKADGTLLGNVIRRLSELDDFARLAPWLDGLDGVTAERKSQARIELVMQAPDATETARRADWVMASGDPASRPKLAAQLTEAWMAGDYDAAGNWLNAKRSADWYDTAAQSFAAGVAEREPATAFDWAVTIADESRRHDALNTVMTRWRQENAAQALEYLAAATVPEAWKAEFSR